MDSRFAADFYRELEEDRINAGILSCFHNVDEQDPIIIDDMSANRQNDSPSGLSNAQQLQWYENQRRRVQENRNAATEEGRRLRNNKELNDYFTEKENEAKIHSLEMLVTSLQNEISELNDEIARLKKAIVKKDVQLEAKDKIIAEQNKRYVQQAATIKHQSQVISNPRSGIATPSNGQDNMPRPNAAYTAPPPRYNMAAGVNSNTQFSNNHENSYSNGQYARQFENDFTNGQYLNAAEQGSPGPRRLMAPPRDVTHSRTSSTSTNPYPSAPSSHQQTVTRDARPTTSSAQNTAGFNRRSSMAVAIIAQKNVALTYATLRRDVETGYDMSFVFSRGHCNFVSTEKDGNMPQQCKNLLLSACAPANAFPFIGKPETRFHIIGKVIVVWINKEVFKAISFAGVNSEVNGIIEATKNKIYQGTPVVIKAMYMAEIASHVTRLTKAPGFKECMNQVCRDKGNQLWKLIKPMMHQKTTNDWNDMYALMQQTHQLAIDMLLSGSEFTFESVDINDRFDPATMINKDQSMMAMSGADLARRGAVVKLPLTPKILARKYNTNGSTEETFVYPATVLTKWSEVRQGFSGHQRS